MISLYVHIPFCIAKCSYCGFYSTKYERTKADRFLAALRKEALGYQHLMRGVLFDTVYIGGGTPSVLSTLQTGELFSIIKETFRFHDNAELTVEANPGTIGEERLALWKSGGVNRISIGIQSFSDSVLKGLDRVHSAAEARNAVLLARSAGFNNIGVDLMYGIPAQTSAEWAESIREAVALGVEHISTYCLSLDEGSRLSREAAEQRVTLPDDDAAAAMYEYAVDRLVREGYVRYEISNFAKPGRRCRHNLNYWARGHYLGIGPGAASFLQDRRFSNITDTDAYCASLHHGESVVVDAEVTGSEAALQEMILLRLRTSEGFDLRSNEREFGREPVSRLVKKAKPLIHAGLLILREDRLKLTERGFLLANEAIARLTA